MFGEDGFGFRAGARDVVGRNARDGALREIIEGSPGLAHDPLSVGRRARAALGDRFFTMSARVGETLL